MPGFALTAADIDQGIESSMWGIDIAPVIFEQTHGKVAPAPVCLAHLAHAILRAGQSSSGSPLDQRADVSIFGIEYIDDGFHQLSSSRQVADAPSGHGIGLGEGVSADEATGLELFARKHGSGTDMLTLKNNLIIAFI